MCRCIICIPSLEGNEPSKRMDHHPTHAFSDLYRYFNSYHQSQLQDNQSIISNQFNHYTYHISEDRYIDIQQINKGYCEVYSTLIILLHLQSNILSKRSMESNIKYIS